MRTGVISPNRLMSVGFSTILMASTHGAFAASSADTIPETSMQFIGPYGLILDNREAVCTLHSKVGDIETSATLDLTSPCYWIRSTNDELSDYPYPDRGISHTLLIAGTALDWDESQKQHQKLPLDEYCSQRLQGIVIASNGVLTSASSIEAPNCIGQNIDEKVFYGVAHDEQILLQVVQSEPPAKESLLDSIKATLKGLFSSGSDDK